ncbi:MAG: hypothetical protein MJE68_14150 [Proteobacteria bacterium]|nr:hypothetical protein [Pseudomonadota bacterium]
MGVERYAPLQRILVYKMIEFVNFEILLERIMHFYCENVGALMNLKGEYCIISAYQPGYFTTLLQSGSQTSVIF